MGKLLALMAALMASSTVASALGVAAAPPPAKASSGMMNDQLLASNPFYSFLWESFLAEQPQREAAQARMLAGNLETAALYGIPEIVTVDAPSDSGEDPKIDYTVVMGYGTTGRLATIRNPLKHWHVYSLDSALGTCSGVKALTSVMAREYKCTYATNGGPFNTNPTSTRCMGAVVSDGVVTNDIRLPAGSAAFGLTKSGQWSMGYGLNTSALLHTFDQLITGFSWLVYDGHSVVNNSKGLAVLEVAPRTVIGVNSAGELLSFVAEGSETAYSGLTLPQTAEWMGKLGMLHAINLDGGGSSASWWPSNNGNGVLGLQGCPTCIDIPFCCERSVETITCVK